MRALVYFAGASLALLQVATPCFAEPSSNIQRAIDAARDMDFSDNATGDQAAYLLVKTAAFRSPVALIFGYVSNADGCSELAADLSEAARLRGYTGAHNLYVCEEVRPY